MALTIPFSRPFKQGTPGDVAHWTARVNWQWWLQRAPMVVLAIPAAYGVGAFAASKLPLLIAIFAGMGYESCYIGAVALADQQHDGKDRWSTALWWCLNLMAVASSIITNTLFFAGGYYRDITPEAATHGAPLALLAFMYGLVLHRSAAKAAARVYCEQCDRMFDSREAYNGHKRTCGK